MNEKRMIVLRKDCGMWIADFMGDRDIFELFGTTKIPTAFMECVDSEIVKRKVESLNPGYTVKVAN